MIRLSIGLEDTQDLLADLGRALARSQEGGRMTPRVDVDGRSIGYGDGGVAWREGLGLSS